MFLIIVIIQLPLETVNSTSSLLGAKKKKNLPLNQVSAATTVCVG